MNKKQIQEFIKKLNEMTGENIVCPQKRNRIRCERWKKTEYFYGNRVDFLNKFVISKFNAENQTHPVGSKRDFANTPNAFGSMMFQETLWKLLKITILGCNRAS